MPQTYYIESDEEIISVIGRLRKSSAEENVFVFPKRALVLQSIINLRLFQREAEKLGKRIIIVSQDEIGRMLAEKAGIETENYSEDFSQKASHLELVSQETSNPAQSFQDMAIPEKEIMPHSNAIGSSNYYPLPENSRPEVKSAVTPSVSHQTGIALRIRNASPEKLTSLNSKRFDPIAPVQMPQSQPRTPSNQTDPSRSSVSPERYTPESKRIPESERGERLKNFYSGTGATKTPPIVKKESEKIPEATVGRKAHLIFYLLGGISILSLVTVAVFFFLPKAEVRVTPYKIVQTIDKELNSTTSSSSSDEDFLAVRTLEKEKEVSLNIATTGRSGGTNQKARGMVILYNNYSTDSQSLVATTRLETADGKLFRLQSGVTVPAMTNVDGKKEAGAIEASVIADQAGSEYNIDPTTFTIPGFKGGPKYEKFSAKSTKTMTGGGSGGVSDVAVVAKIDLDSALREAKEKVKEEFLNEVREGLAADEKILEEQVDIALLTAPELPSIGTVANAFDYKGMFKVRAFVFSEKKVKEKIENASEINMQRIVFHPISSTVTYGDSSADFSSGMIRIKAHALVTLESTIDQEKIKEALLGKDENGIKKVLDDFPEVKNIQIIFHPEWFVQSIPTAKERVTIVTVPGEDAS
jgi:hypothetical protein